MTADGYNPNLGLTPWGQYLNREHAARDGYLAVTQAAHREYLTGPWPDRDSYTTIERQAWATYYAAGREAWNQYRRDMTPPPAPPAPPMPHRVPQAGTGTGWPGDYAGHGQRVATFHPSGAALDEFDARQETYQAAYPATRDGQ